MLILLGSQGYGQDSIQRILQFDDFIERVKQHHPIATQAEIQMAKGEASVLQSRAGFEPKAVTDVKQKYFDDKQYYSVIDAGLKVPTWFGIEVKGGYEQNQGPYLNPESTVPDAGLWYAGITVPIGQGLFIDERRAALKKAQVYTQSTAAEREIILNDLIYESAKTYWSWFESYNKLRVYQNAHKTAKERLEAVIQSAKLGDRPYIDTLEASIQVQNRQASLWDAQMHYANATSQLTVYLWQDGYIPLELEENTNPPDANTTEPATVNTPLLTKSDSLIANHPELRLYHYKVQELEIDRRWKKEQLKPTLDVSYNALSEPVNGNPIANYSINNYTWGVSFNMPILLRKERAGLEMAALKIKETEIQQNTKSAELGYKASATINEWNTSLMQVKQYRKTTSNYQLLLNGENQMFQAGESSLFMVNSREMGFIGAQIKLIEFISKNQKASLAVMHALGVLAKQ